MGKGLPRFEIKRARPVPLVEVVEPCVLCGASGAPRVILQNRIVCDRCFRCWAIGAGVEWIVGGLLR